MQGASDKWITVSLGPEAWAGAPASQPGSLGSFCHCLWPLKWKGMDRLHGRDTDMEAQVHMAPNHEMPLLKPHGPARAPGPLRVTSRALTLTYRIRHDLPCPTLGSHRPPRCLIGQARHAPPRGLCSFHSLTRECCSLHVCMAPASLHSSPLSRVPPSERPLLGPQLR